MQKAPADCRIDRCTTLRGTSKRKNKISTTYKAAFLTPTQENRNAAIFLPSCYAIGTKRALLYKALWVRFTQSKGLIPKPSKSLFYCVTNMKQRSDEAMAVFRVEKNKGYTVMSNHHLRNKELSLKAKGLLSQMLSLPEDWDYTLAGLSLINREKIDAIREAVRELENAGYIQRSRERDEKGRLRGTTYVIYEQPPKLDLPTLEKPTLDNPTLEKPMLEKPTLENPTQLNKDIQKTDLPKKEKLNTDISSTHSIPFHSLNPSPLEDAAQPPERKRKETEPSAFDIYEEIIKDNIEYDILMQNNRLDKDLINEIVTLMLETVCTKRKTIRIAGDDYPAELVKARFMKLDSSHIEFVLNCMSENTTKIRNIKQYLRAVLFNAPSTMNSYYTSLVAHDMASGALTPKKPQYGDPDYYSCNEGESL